MTPYCYSWYNTKSMASKVSHIDKLNRTSREQEERRAQQRKSQAAELHTLDCLQSTPAEELVHLVDLCIFRTFLPDETIIYERKAGEFFYILLQGSVSLSTQNKDSQHILLEVLNRGDCFGEGSLFSKFLPRTTAIAQTTCYTLQLPLIEMRSALNRCPILGENLYRIYLRRLVESKLAWVPVFNEITPIDRLVLAAELQPVCYARNSFITHQGEQDHVLYIIDSGQVVVEQDTIPLAILGEGDFFGEIALIGNQPHRASVRALTPVNILLLESSSCTDLLANYPILQERLQTLVNQRHLADRTLRQNRAYLEHIQRTITHGLFRGTHLLVRKPEHCPPNCQLCVQACAERHGNARLRINGVMIGEYDVLDACRQCRFGAECVEVCPEDAFVWSSFHILSITEACTGCGDCLSACPYNVIARVPRSHHKQASRIQKVQNMLLTLIQTNLGNKNLVTNLSTHRADKCDLCLDYPDLACVRACPKNCISLELGESLLAYESSDKKGTSSS